ncbi:uncharacterized protein [Ptychodera flava]|uniref:uncharacterized protein n=1 Tax=Ptychodera flava TaxID=63121 RepID=UPI003969DEE0
MSGTLESVLQRCFHDIRFCVQDKLADCFDPPICNHWKHLACECGLSNDSILNIEARHHGIRPTHNVFWHWKQRCPSASVQDFVTVAEKLERYDAIQVLIKAHQEGTLFQVVDVSHSEFTSNTGIASQNLIARGVAPNTLKNHSDYANSCPVHQSPELITQSPTCSQIVIRHQLPDAPADVSHLVRLRDDDSPRTLLGEDTNGYQTGSHMPASRREGAPPVHHQSMSIPAEGQSVYSQPRHSEQRNLQRTLSEQTASSLDQCEHLQKSGSAHGTWPKRGHTPAKQTRETWPTGRGAQYCPLSTGPWVEGQNVNGSLPGVGMATRQGSIPNQQPLRSTIGSTQPSIVSSYPTDCNLKEVRSIPRSVPQARPTVFLTYASDQKKSSTGLKNLLENLTGNGFRVYLDMKRSSFRKMGEDRVGWLTEQFESSDFILVCCSPKYIEEAKLIDVPDDVNDSSLNTRYIATLMQTKHRENGSRYDRFIPVLMDDSSFTDVPIWLRNTVIYHWPKDYQQLLGRLSYVSRRIQRQNTGSVPTIVQVSHLSAPNSQGSSLPK